MAYLAPVEFVTKMVDSGESKLLMSTRDTLIRSYMAGAILALAAAFAVSVTVNTGNALVGAMLFPVGFIMLYLMGFDLLTGVFTLAPLAARIERLRRTLCAARAGAVLDSNQSDIWFDVCTERINGLWQLQVSLVAQVRTDCTLRIAEARQDLLDSRGLLRALRANPPPRTHAVDRFFDPAVVPGTLPPPAAPMSAADESAALHDLVKAQSERIAGVEAELEAARRALKERKVIERAKGMLMARLGLSEEAAFRVLQKTSMDQNRRLLDVAESTLALPDLAFAQLAAQAVHNT